VGDAAVYGGAVARGERRLADQELVREHAERPDIDLRVVRCFLDHLWREVVERAAQRAAVLPRADAPAKVGDLDPAIRAHEQVLGLDVAVDHAALMAVVEPRSCLRNVARRHHRRQPPEIGQHLEDLALRRVLDHDVHVLGVLEVAVDLQYVLVPERGLDLHLAPELDFGVVGHELFFGHAFQRADEAGCPVPHKKHAAELAAAQLAPDLEIPQSQALCNAMLGLNRTRFGAVG